MTVVKDSDNVREASGACVYLLPVPLSAGAADTVLPRRNVDIIRSLRHFVVENLRSARRFLKLVDPSIDIDSLSLVELSEHTPSSEVDSMLAPLTRGESLGIISEAGCPAVADPGANLVAAAQRRGYRVTPLVGPSSILLALMASGFNGQRFAFEGYLPIEDNRRVRRIRELEGLARRSGQTQIFIETPYRNNRLIALLASTLDPRTPLCVASDVTGASESIVTLPAAEWRTRTYDYNKIPTIFLIGEYAM